MSVVVAVPESVIMEVMKMIITMRLTMAIWPTGLEYSNKELVF